MALPTLKEVGVAFGGLLGSKGDAYALGVGGAATSGVLKLRQSVLDALNKAGAKLGPVLGQAAVTIPGAVAVGAAKSAGQSTADFEAKYLGLSLTQMVIIGFVVIGGLVIWLIRSKR